MFLEKSKKNFTRKLDWSYLFLLSTAYLSSSINMQGIQSLMPFIQEEFMISRSQAGLYSSAFFLTATAIAIFSGSFVDKIGAKTGMLIGVFSVGGMMIFHGLAPVYPVLLLLAFFAGLGFSIITPSVNKAVIESSTEKNRALSMGVMQSGGGIGSFVGASLLPVFAAAYSWRLAIIVAGAVAVFVGLFIKIKLPDKRAKQKLNEQKQVSFFRQFKKMLKNKKLLLVCSLGVVFGASIGSIPAHYTLFLTTDLKFSPAIAGLFLGILQIGGIFGRPFWGWLSDSWHGGKRRRTFLWLIMTITITGLLFSFLVWRLSDFVILIALFSFVLGTVGMGWMGLFFTVVGERANPGMTGIATGFSLIFIRIGVMFAPPLFGLIADIFDHYNYSWLTLTIFTFIFGILFYWLEGKSLVAEEYKQ